MANVSERVSVSEYTCECQLGQNIPASVGCVRIYMRVPAVSEYTCECQLRQNIPASVNCVRIYLRVSAESEGSDALFKNACVIHL